MMLLLTSPPPPLPTFLPPSLQEQLEEKIKNLDIQINKSKMKSDQEVKEMNEFKAKLGTSETKLSKSSNINTKVCKDLKEDLENAEELLNQILIQG